MLPKIILGVLIGAISANVAAKTLMKTGGTVTGLGFLALGGAARTISLLTKPFWAEFEEKSATP